MVQALPFQSSLKVSRRPVPLSLSPTARQSEDDGQEMDPNALSEPGASGLGTMAQAPPVRDSASVEITLGDLALPTARQVATLVQATPPSPSYVVPAGCGVASTRQVPRLSRSASGVAVKVPDRS